MQDFLKDRPVLTPEEARIIAPATPATASGSTGAFARLVREEAAGLVPRTASTLSPGKSAIAANAASSASAHASQVKTIVENGRVTRIVVTCTCGKVTEIACVY
jgi:hypothetical protein